MNKDRPKPRVFVASGSSGIDLAYAIQANLEDDVETVLWMDSFSPGTPTFVSLFETLNSCDFALALSRHDLGSPRLKQNLLFKLGLFVGAMSSERTFLVAPTGAQRYLPPDLRGLNVLSYDPKSPNPGVAIRGACREIRKQIDRQGIDRTWKRSAALLADSSTAKKKKGPTKTIEAKSARELRPDERHEVFISYSHKDKRWLEKLRTLLVPSIQSNTIFLWDDSMIKPGDDWEKKIQSALAAARVAVLLVSPDFLASRFISKRELPPLLEAAKKDGIKILWVYLRASNYKSTEIAKYQAAHDISKPLKARNGARQDQELLDICERINEAAQAK